MKRPMLILVLCILPLGILPVAGGPKTAPCNLRSLAAANWIAARRLKIAKVGYRAFGTLNANHSNAILFFTWYNGTSKDLEQFFGPDRLVDTTRYFVVAIDALGDGRSSSPSNSTTQRGSQFPEIFDARHGQCRASRCDRRCSNLNHVLAVMGVSMGGMQTFEWTVGLSRLHGQGRPDSRNATANVLRFAELGSSQPRDRI